MDQRSMGEAENGSFGFKKWSFLAKIEPFLAEKRAKSAVCSYLLVNR
jgi:hypothetical protein